MRKLSYNEVVELRACKGMENGHLEFFDRVARFYEGDEDTLHRIEKLRKLYQEVETIPSFDIGAYGAYMKTMEMYYGYMDRFLADIGYTAHD